MEKAEKRQKQRGRATDPHTGHGEAKTQAFPYKCTQRHTQPHKQLFLVCNKDYLWRLQLICFGLIRNQ